MCSWETRPMFFGAGTKLFVEPRNQPTTKPSVFVMKNDTKVACLVKDFYPKKVNIILKSTSKIIEYDPAIVVSPSGKYSAVKLGQYKDADSVTCSVEHNNEVLDSANFEPKKNHSESVEHENKQQTSKSCHEPKVPAGKVNMMSLTLLGLRMMLAKSVAINFLFTAKLFFF